MQNPSDHTGPTLARPRTRLVAVAGGAALLAGSAALVLSADPASNGSKDSNASIAAGRVALAVLGDSDSHSFQDMLWFPPASGKRGGAHRATTFQWTEILARLRGGQVDPGEWGVWGTRGRIAALREWFGLDGRAPRKQDYRYNFATSGAGCENLMHGMARQAPRLLALMERDPRAWRDGVVVLRIGVNSFGLDDSLDELARNPQAPAVRAVIDACVGHIRDAVALIHARHPRTRFVLVGILDNSHWPNYFHRWRSAQALANIASGLDRFDHALKAMAAADPRLAFFDDRAWFARHWGSRDAHGQPAYKTLTLASGLRVSNSRGDHPRHSVLADGHAGVVWNALWAQSLVALINANFGTRVAPISDAEVAQFAALPPGAAD